MILFRVVKSKLAPVGNNSNYFDLIWGQRLNWPQVQRMDAQSNDTGAAFIQPLSLFKCYVIHLKYVNGVLLKCRCWQTDTTKTFSLPKYPQFSGMFLRATRIVGDAMCK